MKYIYSTIVIPLFLSLSLSGCADTSGTLNPYQSAGVGALSGAAIGSALGSVVGAATGDAGTGAWIGAAAGGALGGIGGAIYANHQNKLISSSVQTAATYQYDNTSSVINIEAASILPANVHPGQKIQLIMVYSSLVPENKALDITLVREIRFSNTLVGEPYQAKVSNRNGSYEDKVTYTLPVNAVPGRYIVINKALCKYGNAQKTVSFTVQ
jgi:hypothetical protein